MAFWKNVWCSRGWLPAYFWQTVQRRALDRRCPDLIIGLADHFEPSIVPGCGAVRASRSEQEQRLERWCREYPKAVERHRDCDGRPFRHSYFYPAEQYDTALIDRLSEHCRSGWGEIEVHLHHGIEAPDTAEKTRRTLLEFRDRLAERGSLSRTEGNSTPRYAFVHGNFALANSAQGDCCGVDNEMRILAETGCYADFTLPAAPNVAQVGKINSLYECALPLDARAPHRRGRDLRVGHKVEIWPLIVQGPLMIDLARRKGGWAVPGIENSEMTAVRPPTLHRLGLWVKAGIGVQGRPDWIFIKLHCHGMDTRDDAVMLGAPMREFLRELAEGAGRGEYRTHFVTVREMTNIILAACDGREGNPDDFRDYRLRLIAAAKAA
jgi:hypothetical protein